jgi:hypothetical protein
MPHRQSSSFLSVIDLRINLSKYDYFILIFCSFPNMEAPHNRLCEKQLDVALQSNYYNECASNDKPRPITSRNPIFVMTIT